MNETYTLKASKGEQLSQLQVDLISAAAPLKSFQYDAAPFVTDTEFRRELDAPLRDARDTISNFLLTKRQQYA